MERLKSPREFSSVYKQGKPYFGKYVVVSVLPTDKNVARVGFAVGKKVGKAVTRNKIKRRLRAIMHDQCTGISPGYDVIVGAKQKSVTASFTDLERDLCRVLKNSGILTSGLNESTGVGEEHA
ncbi:MAG: ribonuclease P protein component [Bacillota bacterium]|nr:ribonuclease P protein component [Bacillota bacterium]NLJ02127.1 ribonuclease P protein component [Bacillota bacterium]